MKMMKKTFPLLLCTLTMLCSCNDNKTSNVDNVEPEDSVFMLDGPGSVYEPTPEEVGENAIESVQEVYEAVREAYSSENWQEKSSELDKKYCSKDWNTTLNAVIEKDKDLVEEIGFFDADYWVMGQDFDEKNLHATDFVLEKLLLDDTPWRAVVTLKLQNYGTKPVRVDLVMEDGVWKVDDLTDLSYDLDWKKSMKEYLEE